MKIKTNTFWLFAEDLEPHGNTFEFVEAKPYEKNGKVNGQVFILLGKTTKAEGEFQLFPSKVTNLKEIIAKLGDDDAEWHGKRFTAMPDSDKIHLELI